MVGGDEEKKKKGGERCVKTGRGQRDCPVQLLSMTKRSRLVDVATSCAAMRKT
jgi:hypothetical protein